MIDSRHVPGLSMSIYGVEQMVKLSFLPAESVNSMQQEVTVQKILSMFTEDGSRTRGGLSPQSVPRTKS